MKNPTIMSKKIIFIKTYKLEKIVYDSKNNDIIILLLYFFIKPCDK